MAQRNTTASPQSTAVPADSLSHAEMVALASACKGRELTAAKAEIPEGSTTQVRFAVAVTGELTRGRGTPASQTDRPADIDLGSRPVLLALAKALGVGPARLRTKLAEVTNSIVHPSQLDGLSQDLTALNQALTDAEAALAERLGPQPVRVSARAGSITSSLSVRPLPLPAAAAA